MCFVVFSRAKTMEAYLSPRTRASQNIAKFLPHPAVDDGVHRMALRSGKQKLPDELAYGGDQGEHAELAREALHAGNLRRSIYHLALALTSDPEHEEWLALLDQ